MEWLLKSYGMKRAFFPVGDEKCIFKIAKISNFGLHGVRTLERTVHSLWKIRKHRDKNLRRAAIKQQEEIIYLEKK